MSAYSQYAKWGKNKEVLALPGRTSRPERQPILPPFAARLCQDKHGTDSLRHTLHWPPRSETADADSPLRT